MSYLLSNCLFINLEERKDRLKHVTEQLKTIGISGERVTAVKTKMGAIGCTMSHIKCLEMALERNYENVFICEDDILFVCPNALNKLIIKRKRTAPSDEFSAAI